ncbi:MAG: hypothetical protein HC836_37290 [Richelia sp. RM2_1_2]|nr:hypothetical protein [Richelia sp. RM2_1_2]
MKNIPVKIGDIVVCVDDDSEDEDLGLSGIVLEGRRDLKIGKEYTVETIDTRHVPKKNTHWKAGKEFQDVQESWLMITLKGIGQPAWYRHFKLKK